MIQDRQTSVKPYVYMAINTETEEFYFGYRRANKVPAELDLGIMYFTSSKDIKPKREKFDWLVLKEFDLGNFAKHVRGSSKYVTCLCCHKEYDMGNYSKHLKQKGFV